MATNVNPLDRIFLHQSPVTGQISPARLTLRQLCRLLCPNENDDIADDPEASRHNRSQTQVLEVLSDGTYSADGWKVAQTVPVLREALAQWYYEHDGATKGPLSCRQLAAPDSILNKDASSSTRLYSTDLGQWTALSEIPDLQYALQAFVVMDTTDSSTSAVYDATAMAFPSTNDDTQASVSAAAAHDEDGVDQQQVQDELEAFLASTDKMGNLGKGNNQEQNDDEEEGYESDGGTKYVKDWRTGNWVHEALIAPRATPTETKDSRGRNSSNNNNNNKRPGVHASASTNDVKKRKKSKFAAKNAKCWIYITGLPDDATDDEVGKFCSKVGILDLDPETQRPKVKVYRHKEGPQSGQGKGDASVCYARPESVELALTVLDEAPFRPEKNLKEIVHVERAKFEQRGSVFDESRTQRSSTAKRKVVQMALKQAVDWDGGAHNGRLTGGMKGLRIIVLQPMFSRDHASEETLVQLESTIRGECEKCGAVEKITIFANNPLGVVIVKFTQPAAASEAIQLWDGRDFNGRKVEATFWDSVTDYNVRDEEKEKAETEKRHEQFGEWLESQDIPEELRLKVEN